MSNGFEQVCGEGRLKGKDTAVPRCICDVLWIADRCLSWYIGRAYVSQRCLGSVDARKNLFPFFKAPFVSAWGCCHTVISRLRRQRCSWRDEGFLHACRSL
jgi:hypothetical protein